MFLAIVFILLGLFLLLNAMGIIVGNFWGLFWAIIFLVIGFRLLAKRGKCPMCGWHNKLHGMACDCECDHDHDHTGHDDHK